MKKTIFLFVLSFLLISGEAQNKLNILLAGASFGVVENGWFEIGCNTYNSVAINKSVGGSAIYHMANKMAINQFYTPAELESTDVLVIMHVHNQNVTDETLLRENYADYAMPTTNYAVAYDYVIKRYKADCLQLKNVPGSKYYGTANGKPVKIILCTHWHDARTIYNSSIRLLAEKWNLPLIEWDKNIGFSKDILIDGKQPSLQYGMNNEVIAGVTYAWHMKRGQNEYIQQKMATIFIEKLVSLYGALPTGIQNNEVPLQMNAYPNPFNQKINLKGASIVDQFSIFTVDGKCVFSCTGNISDTYVVDTSGFPNGTYLINAQSNKKRYVQKLLKL